MKSRLAALVASVAAGVVFFAATGTGLADTHISGTFGDTGCGPTTAVTVSSSSRIQVSVGTSAVDGFISAQILDSSGNVVSPSGKYDTPSGGTYGVRVCYQRGSQDPNPVTYDGSVLTGPPGQDIASQGESTQGVAGSSAALSRSVNGSGSIRTSAGLASFSVHTDSSTGVTRVRFDDSVLKLHLNATSGLHVVYGLNLVTITGNRLKIVLDDSGTRDRVTVQFHRLKAAGPVVRGGFKIL
jgi:hypothetical protein